MSGVEQWSADRMATQQKKGFGTYEEASRLQATGVELIRLELGTSSIDTPAHIKQGAKDALDAGLVHYGHLQGQPELREALANKVRTMNEIEATPDEILITNGLTQAAFATFMATLNPGDEVIHLQPGYPQHPPKIALIGGSVVTVPLTPSFRPDPERVEAAITPRTKMLLLVNPVNPVGSVYTKDELSQLADIAIRHDLLVVTDEVYEFMVYDGHKHVSIASLPGMWERTITMFGFSKAYGMEGWRLGYAVAPQPLIQQIMRVTMNESTHPCLFGQYGALAAVTAPQTCVQEIVAEYQRVRDILHTRLNAMPGVSSHLPEGTIYTFPSIKDLGLTSAEFCHRLLTEKHVSMESGSFYGPPGEGYVRICFAAEPGERVIEAMDRMEEFVRDLS